jgi:hypothetical protein
MFKEVLFLQPKLSPSDLNAMDRQLSSRFASISKKFGKGLVGVLAGGGIAGAALGIVDKLLNPLKETQDAIDRTLKHSDDLVTNAKQFGTTAGKLFKLQLLAKSTGLDEGSLDVLITKFQGAVAEAKADPNKETSVRNFVGKEDTAEAFFQFIQSLQKMTKSQQILVQNEVFGEKQILRMNDFLQTDFADQTKKLGGPTSAQLTPGLNKLNDLNDQKDLLTARREQEDVFKKAGIINEGMIKAQDEALKRADKLENDQIKSYQDLAAISAASNELLNLGKEALLGVTSLVVKVTDLAANVKALSSSRAVRGFMKFFGKE